MSPKTQPAQLRAELKEAKTNMLRLWRENKVYRPLLDEVTRVLHLFGDHKEFDQLREAADLAKRVREVAAQAEEDCARAHLAPAPRPEDQLNPPVPPTLVEQCRTLAPLLGVLEKIKGEIYSDRKDHFRITAVKQLVDTALSVHPIPTAAPTAERVTSVITGLALDHFQARLKTTSGDLEALTSDIESVVQRALEASAHLAAAPRVGNVTPITYSEMCGIILFKLKKDGVSFRQLEQITGVDHATAQRALKKCRPMETNGFLRMCEWAGYGILPTALTAPAQPDTLIREVE